MKKLFENWKRYIKEGHGPDYSPEDPMRTVARMAGLSSPAQQPEEVPKGEEGGVQQDNVEMPSNLESRSTSLWTHLNGLLEQWRPTESEGIQYKKELFTLMDDFLKSPDRPSPGAPPPGEESGEEAEFWPDKLKRMRGRD